MSNRIAPKLLAEFIGTFAFVFIGAGTAAIVGEGVGLSRLPSPTAWPSWPLRLPTVPCPAGI
jgi:hypothetical protein